MDIILYHKHYDEKHLEEVAEQMETLGAPQIKAIWSEVYGCWLAVEGCHRIRAAKQLGLMPIIIDITKDKKVTIQKENRNVSKSVKKLEAELTNDAYKSELINFDDEE